jgi:hypothetical protein
MAPLPEETTPAPIEEKKKPSTWKIFATVISETNRVANRRDLIQLQLLSRLLSLQERLWL